MKAEDKVLYFTLHTSYFILSYLTIVTILNIAAFAS